MDKEKIKKLENDNTYIEGIYNYCDRWCERCPFSSKCMLFAMEKEEPDDPESLGQANKDCWDRIAKSFRLAHELLEDWAEEKGIDLESADSTYDAVVEEKIDEKAGHHSLSQKAKGYRQMTGQWMESIRPLMKEKEQLFIKEVELGIDPSDEIVRISDLIDIVQWYQYQIHIKIMRALREGTDLIPDTHPIQNDSNGAAKVALIGIERSMKAWSELLHHFEEQEDDIFPILVTLEQLKNMTLQSFPDAPKFKRPGFDK